MKVLLINPPYPFEESPTPPFGLISLAAFLIEKGFEVRIDDFIITPCTDENMKATIRDFNPDVIGATGVTMNIKKGLSILSKYRDLKPEAVFVMGGPHVTFDADAILRDNPFIDYIVRGEGELTFVELLDAIRSRQGAESIAGLSFRKDGLAVHNEQRPFIEDINILPYPARHLVKLSKYRALGFPINMVTSRGCPHKCIFCLGSKMVGRKVRYFDVSRVVDEFEMLSKMGFKQINIVDDLFTSNKTRCMAVCDEIIRRGIEHPWTAFARVDTVSPELLDSMKRAGCTTLCFGIESANQEILDTVKKKITLAKCESAIAMCQAAGITPMTSYILGLPGETPQTIQNTLEFSKRLSPYYGYHILAPMPGTEVREKADEYGITILTSDWDLYDANRAVSVTRDITAEMVDSIAAEFNERTREKMLSIAGRLASGEPVPEGDRVMYQSLKSFVFTADLIQKELVEKYAGNGASDPQSVRDAFISYLGDRMDHPADDISYEVSRLITIGCLKVDSSSGTALLRWS